MYAIMKLRHSMLAHHIQLIAKANLVLGDSPLVVDLLMRRVFFLFIDVGSPWMLYFDGASCTKMNPDDTLTYLASYLHLLWIYGICKHVKTLILLFGKSTIYMSSTSAPRWWARSNKNGRKAATHCCLFGKDEHACSSTPYHRYTQDEGEIRAKVGRAICHWASLWRWCISADRLLRTPSYTTHQRQIFEEIFCVTNGHAILAPFAVLFIYLFIFVKEKTTRFLSL
jgi:hypothetical protein